MVNECSALNKKLQQLQDQSEKDTETRIQVSLIILKILSKSLLVSNNIVRIVFLQNLGTYCSFVKKSFLGVPSMFFGKCMF